MLMTYHGHSEFLLESAEGFRVLTDPFDAHVGYPMHSVNADAVLVSHGHSDHNFTAKVTGHPQIINQAGTTRLSTDCAVTAIPAFHDDCEGKKRGQTLLFLMEMDGLKIAHLGDLGTTLTEEQLNLLHGVDILLIPVGGYYTIDGRTAADIAQKIDAQITIPMHYKTAVNQDWPIADPTEFLRQMHAENAETLPLLRVTKEDVACAPRVCRMGC